MNELSLFTGAGGGLLGTHLLGWRPVCAVEIEPYCREVLLRRQRDGVLPLFPIWDDVRTFDGRPWRGLVDVVTGGFPCQPFSVAGKGLGIDDPRNMWPETIRVIREVGPRFCLLENVPGLLAHEYFGTILGDLVASGFRVRWDCFSAASVGAPHRRDRLWIVAESPSARCEGSAERGVGGEEKLSVPCEGVAVADTSNDHRGLHARQRSERTGAVESSWAGEAVADAIRQRGRGGAAGCQDAADAGQPPADPWWQSDPADDPESGMGRTSNGMAPPMDKP